MTTTPSVDPIEFESLLYQIELNIACGAFEGNSFIQGAREQLQDLIARYPTLWPQNARVYWAMLCIEQTAEGDAALLPLFPGIRNDANYKRARLLAESSDPALFARIQALDELLARNEREAAAAAEETRTREAEDRERRVAEEAAEQERREAEEIEYDQAHHFVIENLVLTKYNGLRSHVVIPDGVRTIGSCAFVDHFYNVVHNPGIVSITIPSSVVNVYGGAFDSCLHLQSIFIPKNVLIIGERAFSGCHALTRIEVEEGNPNYRAEGNCLIDIKRKTIIVGCRTSIIPESRDVIAIGDYAFCGCSDLTDIKIPKTIKSIGESAFFGCVGLAYIEIPKTVKSIGAEAFGNCPNLLSGKVPKRVKFMSERGLKGTFSDYNKITRY